MSKKRPIITAFEKGEGSRSSCSKNPAYGRRELKHYPALPPFTCDLKKAIVLLDQWAKDRVITLLEVDYHPSTKDQNDETYCSYHLRIGYSLEYNTALKQIFDEKHKAGEVFF